MKRLIAMLLILAVTVGAGCINSPIGPDASSSSRPTNDPVSVETATPEPASPEATAEPTVEPTEAPTEAPTQVPTETPLVTSEYKCRVNDLNLRAAPDLESEVVGMIHFEDRIQVIGPENDQFLKAIYNGQAC